MKMQRAWYNARNQGIEFPGNKRPPKKKAYTDTKGKERKVAEAKKSKKTEQVVYPCRQRSIDPSHRKLRTDHLDPFIGVTVHYNSESASWHSA